MSQLRKRKGSRGRGCILGEIMGCSPKVVCFVGRMTYTKFTGNNDFEFGWQENIGNSKAYVMHFPMRG